MQAGDAEGYDVASWAGCGGCGCGNRLRTAWSHGTLPWKQMGFWAGAADGAQRAYLLRALTLGDTPKQARARLAEDVLDGLRRLNAVTPPGGIAACTCVSTPRRQADARSALRGGGVDVFLDSS